MGVTCSNLVCIRGKNFCIRHTLFSPMWVCLYWPLLFLWMGGLLPVSCCQVSSLYNVWEIQPTRFADCVSEFSMIWWICIYRTLIYQISVIHTIEAFNIWVLPALFSLGVFFFLFIICYRVKDLCCCSFNLILIYHPFHIMSILFVNYLILYLSFC